MTADPSLSLPELSGMSAALRHAGAELCGWHVPFCATAAAAAAEAQKVLGWVDQTGIVMTYYNGMQPVEPPLVKALGGAKQ